MAGIRSSARIKTVSGTCGHEVMVHIPPRELSTVGRRNIAIATGRACYTCRVAMRFPIMLKCSSCTQCLAATLQGVYGISESSAMVEATWCNQGQA